MSSCLISFDPQRLAFISQKGVEESVTLQPEEGCEYYLIENCNMIVKLISGWISDTDPIGEILDKSGKFKAEIPHPGKKHGKLSTSGLVFGDTKGIKIVIEPFDNSTSYFLYYDFSNGDFSSAGITVR